MLTLPNVSLNSYYICVFLSKVHWTSHLSQAHYRENHCNISLICTDNLREDSMWIKICWDIFTFFTQLQKCITILIITYSSCLLALYMERCWFCHFLILCLMCGYFTLFHQTSSLRQQEDINIACVKCLQCCVCWINGLWKIISF